MVISRRVRNVARAFGEYSNQTAVRIAVESLRELRKATPKLTGWAAANWVASVANPEPQALATPTTERGRRAKVGTALARGDRSIAKLRNYRVSQGPIFVVNGVPYIVYLNAGTSAKAPRNFVPQAIARARRRVERQLRGRAGERRVLGAVASPFSGQFVGLPGGS